jgi:hypothetical protein
MGDREAGPLADNLLRGDKNVLRELKVKEEEYVSIEIFCGNECPSPVSSLNIVTVCHLLRVNELVRAYK